jgi:N-acetylmuramoyl-L-alanine amidase
MKRTLFIAFMIFCLSAILFAEQAREVSLRFSRQDSLVRVVIESEEDIIRNASTITSMTSVKIVFPSLFELKKPDDFIFETVSKDRVLILSLKDVTEVRAYKLTAPSRIVIELKTKPLATAQRPEQATQQAVTQADAQKQGQKTPAAVPQQAPRKATEPTPPPDKVVRYRTVVLDPGHGGHDYGIFLQDLKEKEISLKIGKDLSNALQKKGIKVFLTRKVDQAFPLGERITFGSSKNPDFFLSIHATASDKFAITTATADETSADAAIRLYRISSRQNRHLDRSRADAKAVADAIKTEFKTTVILRELPLPLLMSSDAPALLIEYPLTPQKTYDQKERDRLIHAITKGLFGHE